MTLEDLFTVLCDQAIETLEKPPAPARKTNSSDADKPIGKVKLFTMIKHQSNYKCENCQSGYALEVDHHDPTSMGGDSCTSNLRLLCRSCNQRAAIEKLGLGKMDRFVNREIS